MTENDSQKSYDTCGDHGGKTRRVKNPCKRPAGWGTDHPGEGKCKLHGGSSKGRPIKHGRYSVKHRESLQEKYKEFFEDPTPMTLIPELAIQRAFLQEFLDKLANGAPVNIKSSQAVFDMTESISRLVERISRIFNQTALTQVEIQFLQAVLTDLVMRYIDDPERRAGFIAELRSAIAGDYRASRRAITQSNTDHAE